MKLCHLSISAACCVALLTLGLSVAQAQNTAPNVQTLTMDEVGFQPINGLTVKGVTFADTAGANYDSPNGGLLLYTQDPVIEGPATDIITMTFAFPIESIRFGFALSTTTAIANAVQVQLFDAGNNPLGTFFASAQTLGSFANGQFDVANVGLIAKAVVSFTAAAQGEGTRFGLDNLVVGDPDEFQVRYSSNLAIGDSVVNITNTGTSSTGAFPTQNGNICANVYTFSPDEQLISCCTCKVTPNGLVSLSARNDLISNTLTPGVPTSIVVKLVASNATVCNASTVGTAGNLLVPGMAAFGTTIHALPVTSGTPATTYGMTETAFTSATLSRAELYRITTLCGFIQTDGSGFGICKSCRFGGLGTVQP